MVLRTILLTATAAFGQQDQGIVAGRVTDASGGVLPGAIVTATSANGAPSHTSTNAEGHYVLAPLVVGRYQVTIEVPGFKRAVSEGVEIHATARVRLDVQLELGSLAETIAVRPPAPLLQTDTSSLTHTIGTGQIGQLPVNGRNFQQLAMLASGVLPAFGHVDREAGFNANGQWALQNNYILEVSTTTRTSWGCRIARRGYSCRTSMPLRNCRFRRATTRPSSDAAPVR